MIGAFAITLAVAIVATVGAPARTSPAPVDIDAAKVTYKNKERATVFEGDKKKPLVRLVREDAVLLCRRLVAENDEQGDIVRAVCTGDVKLTRGERIVTCDQATYESAASKVTCVGNPVLREGRSVMHGTVLIYDINEDRTELTNARGTVIPRKEPVSKKNRRKETPP